MSDISIVVPHTLTRDEALARMQTYLVKMWKRRYANKNFRLDEQWRTKYKGDFSFHIYLIPCSGSIAVYEGKVLVSAHIHVPLVSRLVGEAVRQAMREDVRIVLAAPREFLQFLVTDTEEP